MHAPPGSLPSTYRLAALVALLVGLPSGLRATTVREFNLLSLERAAGSVFHGRCIAKRERPDASPVPCTEYRFEVLSAVKGCRDAAGKELKTMTIRHVGTSRTFVRPDGTKALPLRLRVPTYRVGEEVVLFVTRESRIGLCAPVGLDQGKFSVSRKSRSVRVRNALANASLFKQVEAKAFEPEAAALLEEVRKRPAHLDLRSLLELCRRVKR